MKTLRLTSLLLLALGLTAYARLAPPAQSLAPQSATGGEVARTVLLRYRWLRDEELPALLAWLRERGPFTRPAPGLLPEGDLASQ